MADFNSVLANIPGLGGYLAKQNLNEQSDLRQVQQMGLLQNMLESAQMNPVKQRLMEAQANLYGQHANQYAATSEMEKQKLALALRAEQRKLEILNSIFPGAGGQPQQSQQPPTMQTAGFDQSGQPGMQPVAGPNMLPAGQQRFPLNPTQAMGLGFVDKNMGDFAFKGMAAQRDANKPPETRAPGSSYLDESGAWRQVPSELPAWDKLVERYQQAVQLQRETGQDLRPNMERSMRSMYPKVADEYFGTTSPSRQGSESGAKAYTVPDEAMAIELGRRLENSPISLARGGPGYSIKVGSESAQVPTVSLTPKAQEALFLSGGEKTQAQVLKGLEENYKLLRDAPQAIESIERAKELIPSARKFMGPLGETKLAVQDFFNNNIPGMRMNLGSVMSAHELQTRAFFNIMDNLKKMDAQPSQLQQKIMMESLGNIGKDPDAMYKVLDAFGDVIRDKVSIYSKQVEQANNVPGISWPHSITVPVKRGRTGRPPLSAFEKE